MTELIKKLREILGYQRRSYELMLEFEALIGKDVKDFEKLVEEWLAEGLTDDSEDKIIEGLVRMVKDERGEKND